MARSFFTDVATASRMDLEPDALAEVERRFAELAQHDARLKRRMWIGILVMFVSGLAIGTAAIELAGRIGVRSPWDVVSGGILTPLTLVGVWCAVFPRMTRPGIRRAMRVCGHDVCEGCGYALDGLNAGAGVSPACPECGRRTQSPLGDPGGDPNAGAAAQGS